MNHGPGEFNGFAVLLAAWSVAVLVACRPPSPAAPVIEFTIVPPANVGGPEKLGDVAGRVTGARPDQRIVLFALSGGVWYVQPFRSWPFTTIEKDATWKNHIHLGTEYTALLVGPDFRPSAAMESLPQRGGSIDAVSAPRLSSCGDRARSWRRACSSSR